MTENAPSLPSVWTPALQRRITRNIVESDRHFFETDGGDDGYSHEFPAEKDGDETITPSPTWSNIYSSATEP